MDTTNPTPELNSRKNSSSAEVELFDAWEEEYIERHGLCRCPNCTMPLYHDEECPNCRQLPHEESLIFRDLGKVILLSTYGIGVLVWLLLINFSH